jgi:hypothetical protein
VSVVAEIDPISLEKYLLPPYDPEFDPFRLPRHVASPSAVDFLVERADNFPAAQVCDLGEMPDALFGDAEGMADFVAESAARQACPDGVYVLHETDLLVRVLDGQGEVVAVPGYPGEDK